MKILLTGCAGFIGSNLVAKLIDNNKIIGIDNFISSNEGKLKDFISHENFKFMQSDIIDILSIEEEIDIIYNLACPASPPRYQNMPIFTLKTNFIGTLNLLELARENSSIFIQASTSEVYGDPQENPQTEKYRGNVNTIGPRSCYDEGKRVAETLCKEFRNKFNIQTRIIRIFNTYGPFMDHNDGRVISNFLVNILKNKPLQVYGDGNQTRSFCYIDDLIDALMKAQEKDFENPINVGNNSEISLNKLIEILKNKFGNLSVNYINSLNDDPQVRRPDIRKAKEILNWEPITTLDKGIGLTFDYFKKTL